MTCSTEKHGGRPTKFYSMSDARKDGKGSALQAIETRQGSGNEAMLEPYKKDQNNHAGVNYRYQDSLGMRLSKCYFLSVSSWQCT